MHLTAKCSMFSDMTDDRDIQVKVQMGVQPITAAMQSMSIFLPKQLKFDHDFQVKFRSFYQDLCSRFAPLHAIIVITVCCDPSIWLY